MLKTLGWIWLVSWLVLAAVAPSVWSGLGLEPTRQILAASVFALPLSGAPAAGAVIGCLLRRRSPDRGRGLAIWMATACTVWVMLTAFPMEHARLLHLDPGGEQAQITYRLAGIGALGCILWIANGPLYFAEPRLGLKRIVISIAAGAGLAIAGAIAAMSLDATSMPLAAPPLLGLLGAQAILLVGLLVLAAVRWIGAGFAAERGSTATVAATQD